MSDEMTCHCGSGLSRDSCQSDIHPDSLAAKLVRLQPLAETPPSDSCESPSRSCCFLVSETEFVLILRELFHCWPLGRLRELISRCHNRCRSLKNELPELSEKINGYTSLWEIFQLGRAVLPFTCVLCEEGKCAVFNTRPFACSGSDIPPEFLFLQHGDCVLFRRPLPLFFWFALVFPDENTADTLENAPFYRDLLSLGETDYIHRLAEYEGGKAEK